MERGKANGATTLDGLLEEIGKASRNGDRVSIETVFQAAGRRSFGPMLLVPGLVALSPLSGIPGIPTMVGVMVLLITSQLLLGRSQFWLPQFVLRRSISRPRFEKAIAALRKGARYVDRLLKPRLSFLTNGPAVYATAAFCLLVSLAAPFMELLPFVISGVGAAITSFALGLIAHDGALTLVAFVFCTAVLTVLGVAAL